MRLTTTGWKLPRIQILDSLSESIDFRWLFMGNFFAQSAQWLQLLTVGWLVKDLTSGTVMSPFFVVVAGGLTMLPGILTAPFGGVLGDRFDRRGLVIAINGFMAIWSLAFAFLVGAQMVTVWHVYVYVFVGGVCLSISMPARFALILDTVPSRLFGNAIATNVITIPGTRMIGPFIGGILIATLGFFWNFVLESMFYIFNLLAYIPMRTPYTVSGKQEGRQSILGDLIQGFKYMCMENRVLLHLTLLAMIPNTLLEPIMYLLPIFTDDVLRRGADFGGYIMAMNGLGGLTMAILLSTFGYGLSKGKIVLIAALASSLLVVLFSHSFIMPLAFLIIYIYAASQTAFRTTNQALVQTISIPEMRARVTSLERYSMGFVLVMSLFVGWFAGYTTVSIALVTMGSIALIASVIANRYAKEIKALP